MKLAITALAIAAALGSNRLVGAAAETESPKSVSTLIASVMEADARLDDVPFSDVILSTTGRRVLPLNPTNASDCELVSKISSALDKVLRDLNAPDHPAHQERRINEVSAHFEKALQATLNALPGFECGFPKTAAGKNQRSGYPDLRLVEQATGRVVYLDPKLFERGSRTSSLRTFYYEPKRGTNKVLDDAHHLIVGFEHAGKEEGHWQFLGWELVDLSHFRVRLKAEFQGSNRDLYRPEAVVGSSRK